MNELIIKNKDHNFVIDSEIWRGTVIVTAKDDTDTTVIRLRKHHAIKVVRHLIELFGLSAGDVGFE